MAPRELNDLEAEERERWAPQPEQWEQAYSDANLRSDTEKLVACVPDDFQFDAWAQKDASAAWLSERQQHRSEVERLWRVIERLLAATLLVGCQAGASARLAPTETTTATVVDCDADGDGLPGEACGGVDCCDDDADVPLLVGPNDWAEVPNGCGHFDNDCDGVEEQQTAILGRCIGPGPACQHDLGWSGSVPECGVDGLLLTTCIGQTCSAGFSNATQRCR